MPAPASSRDLAHRGRGATRRPRRRRIGAALLALILALLVQARSPTAQARPAVAPQRATLDAPAQAAEVAHDGVAHDEVVSDEVAGDEVVRDETVGEPARDAADGKVAMAGRGGRMAGADDRDGWPVPLVEVLTMEQGVIPFERFGHAAICLRYVGRARDNVCFNYGYTDFEQILMLVWGFVRGTSKFWVATSHPGEMIALYRYLDRTIWRQVLPLTEAQALAVEAKLEFDLAEENRYYFYHHYYDNCTTRIRDLVDAAVGGTLAAGTDVLTGKSFRDYSRTGFAEDRWLLVLSDFVLGRAADKQITLWEAMFLPEILRQQLRLKLGAEPELIYQRRGPAIAQDGPTGRGWVLLLAFLLAVIAGATRYRRRSTRLGLAIAAVPIGLIGLVLWAMAVLTPLTEGRYNEALFVVFPLDLLLPMLSEARRRAYARLRLAVLALVAILLLAGIFVQPLWPVIALVLGPLVIAALR